MSISREIILDKLGNNGDLPPFPEILLKIQRKLSDPRSSIGDIAKIIEMDPVLTGKIIKASNSVYFNRQFKEVTSLNMAIIKMGLLEIKKL